MTKPLTDFAGSCIFILISLSMGDHFVIDDFLYTFSQIDTKDILFICGGAFIDIEKTISERLYQYLCPLILKYS